MIRTQDIHSLSHFQRNAKKYIKRLAKTGRPEVLTLNGQATVIVQDADAYQKLMDELDLAQTTSILIQRLKEARTQPGIPLRQWDAKMRKKYNIPREA